MSKKAASVTLAEENLVWLKARSRALGLRSLSETLDRLVTEARTGGGHPSASRSVVGTVDIAADDQDLARADAVIRDLFEQSAGRPLPVQQHASTRRVARKATKPRRG